MGENTKFIIGIICAFILFTKIQLHKYVDKRNNYYEKSTTGFRFNFILMLPYYKSVNFETKKIKILCNFFWCLFVIFFLILIFV